MKISKTYSHNFADLIIRGKNLEKELFDIFDLPTIRAEKKIAPTLKENVRNRLSTCGWTMDPQINIAYNPTINAMKFGVGLMLQTGNITRAFYDLLKFQAMKENSRIECSIMAVPTVQTSRELGSNIANFERITNEIQLYRNIISVPVLIVGIDD
ncbi:BglII/BstYI family type II restriction endonuclease [Listeria newyorkensis]|uniref:Restriction endonuclease BglII n=1 Tax=Listeria newyorkensis TaxID=1497681 RepID=A0A841YZB2_9LIST|nr:BglII/BstYI family type II restriction endonuclease [Listeria newyorkensis]MBC1457897.1 hypothetical protein [Listeria newyorkensis]